MNLVPKRKTARLLEQKRGDSVPESSLSRRGFLVTGSAAAAGLLLRTRQGSAYGGLIPPDASSVFSQPVVLTSRNGILETTLKVAEALAPIPKPSPQLEQTRCYNGMVPGPTLKVRPGDELRIRLVNDLGQNRDPHCGEHHVNGPHCLNTTNLHTHGLHVSPQAPSDDPYLAIEPGAEYQYSFRLPENHPSGTFWYHPHHHGSTALQVMNGMAGALIVEEPTTKQIDPSLRDIVWMVQETAGRDAEKIYTCHPPRPLYTVNGKFQPTLRVLTGEVQRWRFINATATPGGYFRLQLLDDLGKPQPLILVAIDGYALRSAQQVTELVIPPAGRADFLVQLLRTGKYQVKKWRVQGHAEDQILAWVEAEGKSGKMSLQDRVPPPSSFARPIRDNEISKRRTVRFQMCPDQAGGNTCAHFPNAVPCSVPSTDDSIRGAFLIDEKPYDPERTDHSVKLGTAEEWEVVNETGSDHPFHIHVNHFQVVEAGGSPERWLWRDTVNLPASGSVKIRLRFRDFPGRSVLHCHILVHSDMGMMQNFEVLT